LKINELQTHTPGRSEVKYMLTAACMEWMVARKNRLVFEVYRRVFWEVCGKHQHTYYRKTLSNGCLLTIGVEPVSDALQHDKDLLDIVQSLAGNAQNYNALERKLMKERAWRVAVSIQTDSLRAKAAELVRAMEKWFA